MTWPSWLLEQADSPATRVISGIVSLILLFFLGLVIFGAIPVMIAPNVMMGVLSFLGLHLINQLYFAFKEFQIPVCHRCGTILKPKINITYQKHKCKKNN